MPFVRRNQSGLVDGLYANPQPGYAEEWLAEDDEAVVAYRAVPEPVEPQTAAEKLAAFLAANPEVREMIGL